MASHNSAKCRENLRKHGIDLAGCVEAFGGPLLSYEDDDARYGEQRLVSLGWAHDRVVVLIWTDRYDGPRLISCREAIAVNAKTTSKRSRRTDVPYDPRNRKEVDAFWKNAIKHTGVEELREKLAKRGRPAKAPEDRKEQIALRVDKDVVDWYRAKGAGWQTRMNAVLKAFRDASS